MCYGCYGLLEHPLGKGEAESSILSCSTTQLPGNTEKNTDSRAEHSLFPKRTGRESPQELPGNLGKSGDWIYGLFSRRALDFRRRRFDPPS